MHLCAEHPSNFLVDAVVEHSERLEAFLQLFLSQRIVVQKVQYEYLAEIKSIVWRGFASNLCRWLRWVMHWQKTCLVLILYWHQNREQRQGSAQGPVKDSKRTNCFISCSRLMETEKEVQNLYQVFLSLFTLFYKGQLSKNKAYSCIVYAWERSCSFVPTSLNNGSKWTPKTMRSTLMRVTWSRLQAPICSDLKQLLHLVFASQPSNNNNNTSWPQQFTSSCKCK